MKKIFLIIAVMVLWSSQIWAGPPVPPVTLLDEDDMASNSDAAGATQQSIKAYAGGLVNSSSSTPSVCLRDSDAEGAEDTDEYVTCMHGNMTTTTEDGETGDSYFTVWVGGPETTFLYADGSENTEKHAFVQAQTSQAKTYADNDADDETVGTDLTSSWINVTGDNDSDNDSIDLQDGTIDGQKITFYAAALIDADDTFTVNVTDTTCTGCPALVLDEVGDSFTLVWIAATTTWHYYQASDAQ
jgi:hypothetical protein